MCYSLSIFDGRVVVFFFSLFFKFPPESGKGGTGLHAPYSYDLHARDLHFTDYIVQRLYTFSEIGFFPSLALSDNYN